MESIDQNGVISTSPRYQSDIKNVPIITHNSVPVVTTEMLASFYGTDASNIKMNQSRNLERFEIGKHFYKIEGNELKEFKDRVTNSYPVQKRTSSLILWTERGAARHAKMLETDKAWEVFEQLEECYFNKKEKSSTPALPNFSDPVAAARAWADEVEQKRIAQHEAEEAIRTKALIGSKREATAMATAAAQTKRANQLADLLGEGRNYATIKAVERVTGETYSPYPLRKYCKEYDLIPNDAPDKTYGTVKAWPAQAWLSVYNVNIKSVFGLKSVVGGVA